MTSTAASLRNAIHAHGPSRGKRYDGPLKSRIVAFVRSRREQDASFAEIAAELGLCFETVRRWCRAPEQRASMETIVRKRGVSIALGAIGGRCGRESACPRSS
jgi:hypothetical protein